MRHRPIILVLALVLAACAGEDTQATTTTAEPEVTTTTTQAALTTSTTTVPSTTTTTTAAPDPMAYLVEPDEEDRETYILRALLPLNESAFSPEEIGNSAFVEMLVYGAQQACINYFISSGDLVEAISGALSSSPVSGTPSVEWSSEENVAALSTALHVVTRGTSIYCPSEAPDLPPDDDLASEEFVDAWQAYTGDG